MIRIEFSGSANEVLREMQAMIAATQQQINEITGVASVVETNENSEVEEKPVPKSRKSSAASAAESGTEKTSDAKSAKLSEGNSEKAVSKSEEPSSVASGFIVEGVDPTNKDSVRAYLSQSIDILTGAVVTQVFSEFGATSFKGIAPEQYAPMIVRLDELRKAAEAEAAEKGA